MGDYARIQVYGRLVDDAEIRAQENRPDSYIVTFRIGSSYWDGARKERKSQYFGVRLFASQRSVDRYRTQLRKAEPVTVWGQLQARDGDRKTFLDIDRAGFEYHGEIRVRKDQGQQSTPSAQSLPEGWREDVDPRSGRKYYVGPNGQSQWESPAPPPLSGPPTGPPPGAPPSGSAPVGPPTDYPSSPPPGAAGPPV